MKFEEKLVKLRKERTLSQEQLAEKLGVSRQAVSRWESGETTPDMANIIGLCRIFGISADYLLCDGGVAKEVPCPTQTAPAVRNYNNVLRLVFAVLFQMGTCLSMIGVCFSNSAWQYLLSVVCAGICGGLTSYYFVCYGKSLR